MQTALLVIDLQQSLMDEGPWRKDVLLSNVKRLIAMARSAGALIVFIKDSRVGPDGALESSLVCGPDELEIEKDFCDSFLNTNLHDELGARGIEKLIICGMQTDYCIDTTCRRAASLGYAVELVKEGHSTFDHEELEAGRIIAHHNRILRSFPAGKGSVKTVRLDEVRFA